LAVGSVFVFRRRADYHPPFRVPGYPIVPAIFMVATVLLLGNAILDPTSRWPTLAVLGTILVGIPIYYLARPRVASN
jgi:amino acid transporter